MNQSFKILIVDDNIGNQKLISLFIKSLGYEFDCADNGKKAVELCFNNEYVLIFMDQFMPIMDGIEAASIIREKYESLPIIAFTADPDIKCSDSSGNVLFADILIKPYTKDKINNIILKWLNKTSIDNSTISGEKVSVQKEIIFDYEYIAENYLKTGNIHEVKTILLAALDEIKEKFSSLNEHSSKTELFDIFHTIKGTAGLIGGNKLYELARSLENKINNEENINALGAFNSLQKETLRLDEAMQLKLSEFD